MSYEPLHHKYRPQTFAQLVGQEAIATTLSSALSQQRIAPAYLFSGPRGTGKTSSARILAKSLNCVSGEVPTAEPCGVCEICTSITNGSSLDVIEIDAASNTGVDNIRELIERAQFAPVQCRYKVYIIDEVHMLSTAAFNALLKTLEEPPDRVVFVLATTDPQRVLPTIISRCQRFDFRRIALPEMTAHLGSIAQQESINIADEALQLVAQVSQGGLRDAESLLDQLSLVDGQIVIEKVWDLVGAVPERDLLALVQAIASDNGIAVLDCARHLMDRGREPLIVLQNLAGFYRDLLIAKTAGDRQDLVAITPPTWKELCAFVQTVDLATILLGQQHLRESEVQVKNTTQPRLWLEVILMGLLPSTLHPAQTSLPSIPRTGQPMPQGTSGFGQGGAAGVGGAIAPSAMPPVIPAPIPSVPAPSPAISTPPSPTTPVPTAPIPTAPNSSVPIASTPVAPSTPAPAQETPPPQNVSPAQHAAPSTQPLAPPTPAEPSSGVSASPPNPTDVSVSPPTPSTPAAVPNNGAAPPPTPAAEVAPASPPPAPAPSPASPSPAPVEAPSPMEPAAVTYTKDQLDQLWQQVTSLVKPPIAQTLFQQQGRLIAFDGRLAHVAIKSKQLMRLAEQRIEKLSTAFQQVLNSPVRVTMEVAKVGDAAAASPAAAIAPNVAPAPPVQPPPTQQPPPIQQQPSQPTAPPQVPPPASYPPPTVPSAPAQTPIAPAAPIASGPTSAPMPSVPAASPPGQNGNAGVVPPAPGDNGSAASLPPGGPTLPPIQNEDAETQSVKRFANMFNGEIVDLDPQDLELLPPIQSAPQNGAQANGASPALSNHPPAPPVAEPSQSDRPYDPDVPF